VASIPASVTVSAGANSATFTLITANVSTLTVVQVSAAANGVSKTGSLTVTKNALKSLTIIP